MRMLTWALIGFFCGATAVIAQQGPSTEKGDALLTEYFRLETARRAGWTEKFLAEITSVAQWEAEKPKLRRQLFEMLGLDPLPAKTDLQPVIIGRVEHDEFTVEKLHFQSSPGLYVTGNFYLPKNATGPLPTVLYVCGHSVNKKDGISFGNKVGYQHHGAWYARNGYACLTIDTLQLGEIEGLHHGTYKEGMWWWLSRGYTPAGVEAWNCIRALDYLETRPEVDKSRLGVTGRSGGGAYSWWIAALDERIQVAVPTAGITTLKNHIVDGCIEGHCDCMFQVNSYGWDYALVAALVAPRPLLIANTDKDTIFPLDGVVEVHRQVRHIYDLYGKPEQLGLNITEGPHKDTQELQTHEFVWFNRFLKKAESPIDKVATKFFTPEQLRVFDKLPADQRNTRIHEEFVPAANHAVPQSVEEWDTLTKTWREELRRRCLPDQLEPSIDLKEASRITRREIQWTHYEFTSEKPYRLPLIAASAEGLDPAQAERVVLYVLDQTEWERVNAFIGMGQSEAMFKLEAEFGNAWLAFLEQCRQPGTVHLFLAPRGVGPTEWTRDPRERIHIRRRFALLGRTDDAARVGDVVQALIARQTIPGLRDKPLTIRGSRQAAGWGLYAAILGGGTGYRLELTDLPASHRDGPVLLSVARILELPHAVALALDGEKNHVTLRFTQPVDPAAWEFPVAVDRLRGEDQDARLVIEGP